MRIVRQGICLWAVVLLLLASVAHAQTAVTPEDEFKQKIRVSQDIQPLGDKPFGENINLYNGSVSFTQTDVDAPGNGPDLLLTRTYSPADLPATQYFVGIETSALTDWTLNVPRIETLSARDLTSSGQWFFLDNTQRCTSFHAAPDITVQQTPSSTPTEYEPGDWWHGYQMITADGTSQDLLKRDAANTLSPTVSGKTFPIVTKQQWMISCLAQTSNGQPGEAFLAVAPDGTRYWFDWLAYKQAPSIIQKAGAALQRRVAMMLASHIEDRFGNSLTYTYDAQGNPTRIEASDGRVLTLAYQTWTTGGSITGSRLTSATLQPTSGTPRTWTYAYAVSDDTPVLSQVQLPDGTSWGFDFPVMTTYASELFDYVSGCQTIVKRVGDSRDFVVRHPSGLQGTFTLTNLVRGRSDVPGTCSKANPNHWKTLSPDAYSVRAVTQKVLSGAGLTNQTWNFAYSPANESAIEDCTSGCASTVWTDVTDPEGHATRHTFSNRFDASESLLLRTDYYAGAIGSAILRSEANTYAAPDAGPWPSVYGSTQQMYLNAAQTERLSPANQRVITQDGDTYTWQAESFDAYAQITKTKRYNSITGQVPIEEATAYRNDTNLWVLGLPLTVTNVATGEVESSNTYDTSNDTLLTRSRFGQTLMHYTFNSAGQLAGFTDGNTHTTTLDNYKRGIPQAIGYPDGTSESLAVDDFGQITSITDQAAHTTSYTYDPVGRVTQVTYPVGDEVAWYPTHFAYAFVTSAERGIAANHWRRTVTTGNASTVTYFDAMLRPLLSDTSIIGTAGSDTSTANAYDAQGQATFASYPVAGTPALSAITSGTHHSYDALGRPTQSIQDSELGPLTRLTAYLSGARRQLTDPKANITTTSYQVFDQPGGDAVIKVQAPQGITQTIARDLYGAPLSITQSGLYGTEQDSLTRHLYYDIYHRLCRSTEPESGSTVMHYDAANNLDWSATGLAITGSACSQDQVAASVKTARTYDAMNRVLTISPPTGTQGTTYTYDTRGHVASASSGISLWWANYDTRGNITGEALWVDGQSAWGIGYSHDAYNHLSAIGYPGSPGEGVAYAPDALGRATQAGSYASSAHYFPDGSEQGHLLGNGISALIQKNTRLLPSGLSYALGGTQRLNEAYVYDKDANLTSVTDLVNGQNNQTLGYDGLNRLTSAIAPNAWGTQSYAYDALNNLRQNVNIGFPINMHVDANNRLTSVTFGTTPFTTYQNDTRGNRTAMTYNGVTTQYSFDAKNQLLAVPGVASYAYDAAGRRIMKTPAVGGAAAATYSFYNQAGQLMFGYDAATGQGTNYIYLNGKLIARHKGSTVTYLLTDRLGSPVREADASGNVTASFSYLPYGGLSSGPNQSQPGFTGHVNDPETAFVYMQARYYDGSTGYMLSVDPVGPVPGDVFGFNRYAYANNNPIINVDPDGRATDPEDDVKEGRVETPGVALRAAMNEAVGKELLAQIRDIDPTYQLPSVSGPQGGPYYTDTSNEILSSDLSKLQKDGPPQCVAPALPTTLVGDTADPRAGSNRSGTKFTSGNLLPKFGGVGDYQSDLKTLAGDTRLQVTGDSAPPGSQVGANGVFGRSPNSSGGKSIDIPANGDKPHETLHYEE
ncbi:RHS repeat-associated core domain-containing protein [Rhodanobacter sp. IGA1.0]|uniref:RHS repeat-associated core domain-containing protein n=1 Tax=Rhodanobacter sp. IGA1.0 TaxID=3158582 RepID=A0AAU7QKH3_9GAMM